MSAPSNEQTTEDYFGKHMENRMQGLGLVVVWL